MCIKILKDNEEFKYNAKEPLAAQIDGCDQIVVDYQPFDTDVDSFLKEVEKFAQTGIKTSLNIKVVHNDHIYGVKVKKRLKNATNDIRLNEVIKLMVLTHAETDKKLEDLANYCTGITCDGK